LILRDEFGMAINIDVELTRNQFEVLITPMVEYWLQSSLKNLEQLK
jgi:hypothetical protein